MRSFFFFWWLPRGWVFFLCVCLTLSKKKAQKTKNSNHSFFFCAFFILCNAGKKKGTEMGQGLHTKMAQVKKKYKKILVVDFVLGTRSQVP